MFSSLSPCLLFSLSPCPCFSHRQIDAHRSPFSFLTLHFHLAAVFFDDLLSDHHSQSGAVTLGRVEGLEQTLFGLGGHTHATIDYADHQFPAIAVGLGGRRRAVTADVTSLQFYAAVLRRRFDGVDEEVEKDFSQLLRVVLPLR